MNDGTAPGITVARVFLLTLVVLATLAFLWLIAPFSGAILWAVIAAVLFDPLNLRLLRAMPGRRNLTALTTLLVITGVVVVPAMLLGAALVREATTFYDRLRSREIDPGRIFVEAQTHMPEWLRRWLFDIGLGDLDGLRAKIGAGVASSFQGVAAQVLNIGQGAFGHLVHTPAVEQPGQRVVRGQ